MIVLSRKIKVYVVDVEEKTISRLEEMFYKHPQLGIKLIGHSHNYTSCVNDLSRAKEADVYLISAFLPDQMGIYLIEKIKRANPNGKICIMVSTSTRNQAEVAKEKGADDIILKPFKPRAIVEMIYSLADVEEDEEVEEEVETVEEETHYEEPIAYDTQKEFSSRPSFEEELEQKEVKKHRSETLSSGLNDFEDDDFEDTFHKSETNPYEYPDRYAKDFDDPSRKKFHISQNVDLEELEDEEEIEEPKEEEFSPKELHYQHNSTQNAQNRSLFDIHSDNPLSRNIYQDDDFDGNKPNILAVFSSTSSAGKTTLLTNVAIAIQKYSDFKPKICIVDFNLTFPSVLYKFHQDELIMPERNIFDIVEDKEILDEELIRQALVTHEPSGIKILETPPDAIRDISIINRDVILPLFEKLRSMFDLVLVDTSTNIRSDSSSFPLTISDKNIIIMEPDLSSLLHTRKFITMLKSLETHLNDKITSRNTYILNKDNPRTGIHVDTVKRTIHNNSVRLTIPEDVNITHLSNDAKFIIHSSLGVSREIKELARIVYPLEKELSLGGKPKKSSQKSKKPSIFDKWFKK